MNKGLANRIGRIECDTLVQRRAAQVTICPWEWTTRLAAWSPRYAEIVAWTLPLCPAIAPAYPRKQHPFVRADFAETVLIQHSRLAYFRDRLDQWQPTPAELTSMEMYLELNRLGKAYIAATGDAAPCGMPWWQDPRTHAELRRAHRGFGRRHRVLP